MVNAMRTLAFALAACLSVAPASAADSQSGSDDQDHGKVPAAVDERDGFPTGRSTPEGAASDMARSFLLHDFERFNEVRFKYDCETKNDGPNLYQSYLTNSPLTSLEVAGDSGIASPNLPTRIVRVFAAREFSADNSYRDWGLLYGIQERRLVDVVVVGKGGMEVVNRTFVVKAKDGQWYAMPKLLDPLFPRVGLDMEPASTIEYSEDEPGRVR